MLREVDDIVAAVPAANLCIQWDTAVEFAVIENVFQHSLGDPISEVADRLVRTANYMPREVELGLHLCYGDSGGKYFKEPKDTTKLVVGAKDVITRLKRPPRATGSFLSRLLRSVGQLKQAQLREQPRILDGNYCLSGEVLYKFNLLVGKWAY